MRFLRAIPTRTGRRQRLLILAAVMLLASFGLLSAGFSDLLLGKESEPPVVADPIATPTKTVATPTPSNAAIARLIVDKIGIDASVVTLGLDDNGIPQTPDNADDIAWYDFSGKPGWGSNAVFTGHYDWTVSGKPVTGVFYSLADLNLGDVIEVKLVDGTGYRYRIVDNLTVPDGDPRVLELMRSTPSDMVTLITCGLLWPPASPSPDGLYWHRRVVRAELIRETAATLVNEAQIEQPRQEESPA